MMKDASSDVSDLARDMAGLGQDSLQLKLVSPITLIQVLVGRYGVSLEHDNVPRYVLLY
jgi:hypothetical protein